MIKVYLNICMSVRTLMKDENKKIILCQCYSLVISAILLVKQNFKTYLH